MCSTWTGPASCSSTSLPSGPDDSPSKSGAEWGPGDVLLTIFSSAAPFFGARELISESEVSRTAKLSLKAGSFCEVGDLRDEAGENSKIFLPARVPIEDAARLRKTRMPTPFFPAK